MFRLVQHQLQRISVSANGGAKVDARTSHEKRTRDTTDDPPCPGFLEEVRRQEESSDRNLRLLTERP
jgi:hypothetical protein